jgi:hypothetical protein
MERDASRAKEADQSWDSISLHSFPGNPDRHDQSPVIKSELVDAHDPMIAIRFAKRAAVVDDVPVAGRRSNDRVVSCSGRHRGILLQDLSDALERPER